MFNSCLVFILLRIVWLLIFEVIWKEICVGKFVLIVLVIMFIDGCCVVMMM